MFTGKVIHTSYTEAHATGLDQLKETVYSLLRAERHPTLGRHAALAHDPQLADKVQIQMGKVWIQMGKVWIHLCKV